MSKLVYIEQQPQQMGRLLLLNQYTPYGGGGNQSLCLYRAPLPFLVNWHFLPGPGVQYNLRPRLLESVELVRPNKKLSGSQRRDFPRDRVS